MSPTPYPGSDHSELCAWRFGMDAECDCGVSDREPSDDEIYNRHGVEGGIAYSPDDGPVSLGEHDWRL